MKHIDPKIELQTALDFSNNNQSKLACLLEIERSSVNEWVKSGRKYLPPLQAYRFRELTVLKQPPSMAGSKGSS